MKTKTNPRILPRRLPALLGACLSIWFATCPLPAAAASAPSGDTATLRSMSHAFETLVSRLSPAVVEVRVSAYGTADPESQNPDAPISRESRIGSGVIVDPDGYIVTNRHVVKWARRVNIVLTPRTGTASQATSALDLRPRVLPAKVVGTSAATDLAVLKVDATGLPTVPFARYNKLRQGQIVLALGSPMGLKNSVSLGLVSAVVRQDSPDSPMVYIQTDAAINPGNSGGALVDVDGNLVGINSSILSQSGGNEGIGFAIPSGVVRYVYQQIRKHGYVNSGTIGTAVQAITPELATALGLSLAGGVIVTDVAPGGPAAHAGLRPYDLIQSIDGAPVNSVPTFVMSMYLRKDGDHVRLGVMRDGKKLSLNVPVIEEKPAPDSLVDLANLDKDQVRELGIIAIDLTPQAADFLSLQNSDTSGVVVAAITDGGRAQDLGLRTGDIIDALNAKPVKTVAALKAALRRFNPGAPAVLQVERDGRSALITFEVE